MLYPTDEEVVHQKQQQEDIEFLEFQQELEQESRLHHPRGADMDDSLLDQHQQEQEPLTPISSFLVTTDNSSSSDNNKNAAGSHEMDVGMDLNLDSSLDDDEDEDSSSDAKHAAGTFKNKQIATTPKTAATTKVDDDNNSSSPPKSSSRRRRRRSDIPKDISVKDSAMDDEDETAHRHHLLLLDQQIVLEQFGVYSDLSGEEEEEEEEDVRRCLQDAATATLKASVNAGAKLVSVCQQQDDNGNNKKDDSDGSSSLHGGHSKFCSSLATDCCGQDGQQAAYQHCYEGLQLFANGDDDDDAAGEDDHGRSTLEQSSTKQDQTTDDKNENPKKDNANHRADAVDEDDDDDDVDVGEIEAMIGGSQYAVNRSFSSFTHPPVGTFCQGNCDVMSQYWERIKLALSNNRNGDNAYQAIDSKSQASLFSFFDNADQQLLEKKDSLSYSSVDDDGIFASPFFPVLEKCHNGDASFSNEMDKMISCALPNGLVFCTIWLDHPDYMEQAASAQNSESEMLACALAIDESNFYIRNGCDVVWKIQCDAMNDKRFVEFPHRRATQASDLLRCFSWAGDKDHAVVYQLNQVLAEMRRAMEKDSPQEAKECTENQLQDNDIQDESTVIESAEEDNNEIEVVLWSSPKRIFPHFVDVHGNQVSTVHLVREKKTTLATYSCASERVETTSFGRIVFFVKTIDSIPSLLSAPSDEMVETEQGEETILEESVADDDEEEEHPHDEHQNEEWSAAERSNVTTMIDNRTRSQRVRYILEGETDEEFSEKFGL
mmetsp:Transcript_40850/g.98508  ORF Transcript_40850/g.98508 Transcript_40850/m.98508 type:complete len:773 (+) Transcript_40850:328-2646(+)